MSLSYKHNIFLVNWTLSIVLFPDLMAYFSTDYVFLPAQGPPLVPLSSFSVTKVFRWPNKFCFFRELLFCLMLYCEPVLVTVCDSCSCIDVKSGLLCLTLDLNPCNKRKPHSIWTYETHSFQETKCRNSTPLCFQINLCLFHAASISSQSFAVYDLLRCTDKLYFLRIGFL